MVRNLLAITGLIALALVSAATLQAQGYFDTYYHAAAPRSREAVSIAGLDLTSPAGIDELEARINAAIDRVCPAGDRLGPTGTQSTRECREDTIAGVRPQVDRAVAEARERYAVAAPVDWRRHGPPPADRYAARAPSPPQVERYVPPPATPSPPPPPKVIAPPPSAVVAPAPPPAGGRLVRRTVTTTTVTTTTGSGAPVTKVVKKVVVKRSPARSWAAKSRKKGMRSPAFARRGAVAGSWLPPVAWASADRATLRAFRTGKLARWGLTDRDGIARSGYVTVSAARWLGGSACRNVQVVKYNGRKQLVVASGMRCRSGRHLVNRSV